MNEIAAHSVSSPETIRVLVFTSGGVKVAVDTDQVIKLTGLEEAEGRGWKLSTVPDRLWRRNCAPPNLNARVLMAGSEDTPIALTVDRLEDILSVPISDLRPMPHLISLSGAPAAVWSAMIRNDEVIMLVDLSRLPSEKARTGSPVNAVNSKEGA